MSVVRIHPHSCARSRSIRIACFRDTTAPDPVIAQVRRRVEVEIDDTFGRDERRRRAAPPPTVVSALAESGLEPRRLELVITESVLLADHKTALEVLRRIRELGVRVSMDYFGTGYSSLSYLRSFPFDKIKIDQSFVRASLDDPAGRAIVRAIAALGQSLGMTTTAEGVETEAKAA